MFSLGFLGMILCLEYFYKFLWIVLIKKFDKELLFLEIFENISYLFLLNSKFLFLKIFFKFFDFYKYDG